MSSYHLLSNKVKSRIDDMRWERLSEIQEKAIPVILNNDKDVLIISGTASGKTEAVLFPLITKIKDFNQGIKILYISPLKALINDQDMRLKKLLREFNIETTMWHGDAPAAKKKRLLDNPKGILQITPESLEAFFIYREKSLIPMFSNLDYVVIDEIHSFVGNERGYQLESLLHRLKQFSNFNTIGLSATISDKESVKKWMCKNSNEVIVVEAKQDPKKIMSYINYFESAKTINEKNTEDIKTLTENFNKAIIFANSRTGVEEIVSNLNEEHEKKLFFPHHSYVSKQMREFAESKIKHEDRGYIVATTTLELGIDIGNLDIVIQFGHTSKVSSLAQRVGRSGRKQGAKRIIQIYCNCKNSLITSEIQRHLIEKGIMEKFNLSENNYDYTFHQILSLCSQYSGINVYEIIDILLNNPVSKGLNEEKLYKLIKYMIKEGYLEYLEDSNEFLLTTITEKIVRNKDFLTFFESAPVFNIYYNDKLIGNLDFNILSFEVGNVIILSGRKWRIKLIDLEKKKIIVDKSKIGKLPTFNGDKGDISDIIRKTIREMLVSEFVPKAMDHDALLLLKDWNNKYKVCNILKNDFLSYRESDELVIELFLTIKQSFTLELILRLSEITPVNKIDIDEIGNLHIPANFNINTIKNTINKFSFSEDSMKKLDLKKMYISKYAEYLNEEMKFEILLNRKIDLEGLKDIFNKANIVHYSGILD